jgi:hypothetical protein
MSRTRTITMSVSGEALTALDVIKNIKGISSDVDVFRHALAAYKWVIDAKETNSEIILKKRDGTMEKIHFF